MNLSGVWYNELGSTMTLQINGSQLAGTYQTAVGNATGLYQLTGSFDPMPTPGPSGISLGWVVAWNNPSGNSHSVTAWCGQCQVIGGRETLTAMWLLSEETDPQNDWKSVFVGKDVFTRTQPTPRQNAGKVKTLQWSHPAKRAQS